MGANLFFSPFLMYIQGKKKIERHLSSGQVSLLFSLSNFELFILLYFNHFLAKKNTYKFTYIKKTKMPREGQKQEQVPLQMAINILKIQN